MKTCKMFGLGLHKVGLSCNLIDLFSLRLNPGPTYSLTNLKPNQTGGITPKATFLQNLTDHRFRYG